METELLELWSASRKAVMFITHDPEEAISLSDRVIVLSAGPATRPIGEFAIDLQRSRDVADIGLTPRFVALHEAIWGTMKEEVLQAEGVFDINAVFAGILVLTAFALLLDWVVTHVEARLLVWRPRTAETEML